VSMIICVDGRGFGCFSVTSAHFHEEYEYFCHNMRPHGRDLNYASPEKEIVLLVIFRRSRLL
jgi:hypothetical protein